VTSSFDPIAVGDQIAACEAEAAKAKGTLLECSKKSGALLLDVQRNHSEHLEAICIRAEISRSRRYELLAIAGGRRTEEENRQISKDRQDRKREKDKAAKANALPPPRPAPESVTTNVTDSPEASAERLKAEFAAMEEAEPTPVEAAKPQPASVEPISQPKAEAYPSREALAEFKVAADRWFPTMSDVDLSEAIDYALAFMHRRTRARRAA
jgi:hypothetical protein